MGIKPKAKKNRRLKIVDRGLWTHQTLGDFLKNTAYIGMLEVNRRNKDADSRHLKPHQQYQLVKASWPAMERRRLQGAERRVFLVSGIIRCKECGRPMVGQSSHGVKNVHRYYVCSASKGDTFTCSIKRIRADEVEEAVNRHVSLVLRDGRYLDQVAARIAHQGKDHRSSQETMKARIDKEIRDCEREMESAFKLQLTAPEGSEALKFVIEKLESLGKKKVALQKALNEAEESDSNVVSLAEVRQDIEDRVHRITKGWAKLPAAQKRRALRRLIQQLLISPKGLDIYYNSSAIPESVPLGGLSKENERPAKVIPLRARGTSFQGSKSSIQNCTSARMVTSRGLEPRSPV